MAITRTPIIDDNGTGTTGTIINNAWKTELYNQIDAAGDTQGPHGQPGLRGQWVQCRNRRDDADVGRDAGLRADIDVFTRSRSDSISSRRPRRRACI